MSHDVIFSVEKHLGLITLNRPKALHALTYEMVQALFCQLKAWALNEKIHAVVIQSTEDRAFCAGGDVRSLYEMGLKNPDAPLKFFGLEYQLNDLIAHYPKPYVPLLHGITFGGGVGLSLHSPYSIAAENFIFSMPETSIGFFPDVGASYILSRIRTAYGRYLALTGARLDVKEALSLKLIYAIVPKEAFGSLISDFLETDLSYDAQQKIKEIIKAYQLSLKSPLNHAHDIEKSFNAPTWHALKASLEKENTAFGENTRALFKQKSPISLAVTFEQLKRAQTMSLEECLKMDYTLAYHFMQNKDFFEGVRALLIDKDKNPHWSSEDDEAKVQSYFSLPEHVEPLHLWNNSNW